MGIVNRGSLVSKTAGSCISINKKQKGGGGGKGYVFSKSYLGGTSRVLKKTGRGRSKQESGDPHFFAGPGKSRLNRGNFLPQWGRSEWVNTISLQSGRQSKEEV